MIKKKIATIGNERFTLKRYFKSVTNSNIEAAPTLIIVYEWNANFFIIFFS